MENQRVDILISSVETMSWGVKIKDEKGLVYNIPQYLKNTDKETVAYQKLSQLPNNGMNLKKTISFVAAQNSQGGQSRYIRDIYNISGQPNIIGRGEQIARQGIAYDKTKSEEEKWDEIARGKVRHGVVCEFIRLGAEYELTTINKINKWVEFIMTGEMFPKFPEQTEATTEATYEKLDQNQLSNQSINKLDEISVDDLGDELTPDDIPF